jgi:uncharacterized protein (DUF1810 family)
MASLIDLDRFLRAQQGCHERVKREMAVGRKESCWIWFVFPQIRVKKAGVSHHHVAYAIRSLAEAEAYLKHRVLGARIRELSEIVLAHSAIPIDAIMGSSLDATKFRSSMTLFSLVSEEDSVFHRVLDHFFNGKRCPITLERFGRPTPGGETADDGKAKLKGKAAREMARRPPPVKPAPVAPEAAAKRAGKGAATPAGA